MNTPVIESIEDHLDNLQRLHKDLRKASSLMGKSEARALVDAYLSVQRDRISHGNQRSQAAKQGEGHEVLDWFHLQSAFLERQIKLALQSWAKAQHMGRWAMEVPGIGPVIASGLCSHIEIEKAPTVGHIWAFAGLDPTKTWEKGQKRPWNARLKVLCFYAGESFIKCVKSPYRRLYDERKAYLVQGNSEGKYAELAAEKLKVVGKTTEAYKSYKDGKLPAGHIHASARRWMVKQFLADWHGEAYRSHYGKEPPLPYPIAILGHAHLRPALA